MKKYITTLLAFVMLASLVDAGWRKVYDGGYHKVIKTPKIDRLSDLRHSDRQVWILQPSCFKSRAKELTGPVYGSERILGINYLLIDIPEWEEKYGGFLWKEGRDFNDPDRIDRLRGVTEAKKTPS